MTMPDFCAEQSEINAWNRAKRHAAARKLHRASWAQQEGDTTDAIADIRAAAALVLRMTEPNGEVLRLLAIMAGDLWAAEPSIEIGPALRFLVLDGEELANVPDPF